MSDIRKWFMKQHDKGSGNGSTAKPKKPENPAPVSSEPDKLVQGAQESTGRRKTSKYFSSDKQNPKEGTGLEEPSLKRKAQTSSIDKNTDAKPPPGKKAHKVEDNDDDFVLPTPMKDLDVTPSKKLKTGSGRGAAKKAMDVDESDEDNDVKDLKSNKAAGRGRGGRSALGTSVSRKSSALDENDEDESDEKVAKSLKSGGRGRGRAGPAVPAGGRGRGGGGRGGFMNFGERKDPPHKGEKEIPEGASDCLAGLTFVISGTLDSLEREEAEDLIKRYGGRVTGSVSKKTNYLLCDEDIEGRKSSKAKELGTNFLTEDGLLDMIRKSKKSTTTTPVESPKPVDKVLVSSSSKKTTPVSGKKNEVDMAAKSATTKSLIPGTSSVMQKKQIIGQSVIPWTEKYRPKVPSDIIGNQSIIKQLHDWLARWNEQFLNSGNSNKGKKQNDSGAKKAVLLSGTPGIGKTTSAKLVSQMLGFNTIEVNASDSRGKADSKIEKGIGGSTANLMKELISNQALSNNMNCSQHQKTVLIMDEVDGMSAGDRGGVADLIASIKISKIPIICICNDRYSQKLKSLVNYCLLLNFRKPTKQQMAKRLLHVANAEGLEVNEIALEELADRVNGDMRMALNQLQYMSLSMSVIKYDDIRQRLQSSAKDEDISPFTAVDKLFGFNGGKLRMDERIDLSMSDPDLVPLIIQENYINYKPSSAGRDENDIKRMNLLAQAAESIADGDIINVQIRRYRQWQLSQASALSSSIIPAALLHGQRQTLEQGERNFNRFGGWLGKNSTMGKNYRLLEDLHVHVLASCGSYMGRSTLRLDYLTLLLKQTTDPLRVMSKDEAVQKVVEFMDSYSIRMDDFDTMVEISKYQGHPNPLEGIQPAVKAALTKAYNKGSSSRVIRTADLITLPGIKKAPKKRVAAMLEPAEETLVEDNDNAVGENEEDNSSESEDSDETVDPKKKLQADLQSLNSKGIQVEMDIKSPGSSSAKRASSGRGRGKGSSDASAEKKSGRGSGAASKRKR